MSNIVSGEQGSARPSTWQRAVVRARRVQLARLVAVAVVALAVGVGVGRWSAPVGSADARVAVERHVLPHALDADGIWTSSSDGERPPVSEGLIRLREGDADAEVHAWTEEWLSRYGEVLVRLEALDLPPEARPVQRQFIAAVTVTRDAVEVLRYATEVEDPEARELLLTEVLRLRQRAEDLTQAARASVRDLGGQPTDVSGPTGDLPPLISGG